MNLKKYQPLLEVLVISLLFYLSHKLFFILNETNPKFQDFHFPIEYIYGFFFTCSLVIILILIKVKEKSIDNVGNTFLLTTCIKMAISYTILLPILQSKNLNRDVEKIDFFIIFALFLTIETIVTIRILNNKQ
ncbi:MAG: hypothetical protein PHC28_00555 [Flavobacterium sp.]|uniref:hypothetical protein n=1 Tax=Flavobacterium sp. TaxID=239 RepID=UPI002626B3E5|nr:hypothetical protein [Flavobacterium sp.]MDD5148957.1 hypothetical protein [Flavobacterium sp.]